jgi:hypothetical protein
LSDSTSDDDDVTDINQYFKQFSAYQLCRTNGHMFRPTHTGYLIEGDAQRPTALYKRLLCNPDAGGCGLTADDTFHPYTLERIGNRRIHYGEKPGYLAKGTHITRQDARLWEARSQGFGEKPRRAAAATIKKTGGNRKRAR